MGFGVLVGRGRKAYFLVPALGLEGWAAFLGTSELEKDGDEGGGAEYLGDVGFVHKWHAAYHK